jgi:twitching motility protein PilI
VARGAVQDPIALLRNMQRESMANTIGLPQEIQAAVLWSGVGFRLGEMQLVAPLDQVLEVLPAPSMTLVPGTKSWLKGVANVRGNLLTIVDLCEYFDKPPVFIDDRSRLMVMNVQGLNTALLVNEVLGLRHFDEETERQNLSGLDDPVMAHLSSAFLRDGVLWGVFDLNSLAESPTFRHVAG